MHNFANHSQFTTFKQLSLTTNQMPTLVFDKITCLRRDHIERIVAVWAMVVESN
jgi:hypothetical protein